MLEVELKLKFPLKFLTVSPLVFILSLIFPWLFKVILASLPGGPVVKILLCSAGDSSLTHGLGRSHML